MLKISAGFNERMRTRKKETRQWLTGESKIVADRIKRVVEEDRRRRESN